MNTYGLTDIYMHTNIRHGMALFFLLFNRWRVSLFPISESPSALSGWARILISGCLFYIQTLTHTNMHTHQISWQTGCLFIFKKNCKFRPKASKYFLNSHAIHCQHNNTTHITKIPTLGWHRCFRETTKNFFNKALSDTLSITHYTKLFPQTPSEIHTDHANYRSKRT
jgi:hypothetical protein